MAVMLPGHKYKKVSPWWGWEEFQFCLGLFVRASADGTSSAGLLSPGPRGQFRLTHVTMGISRRD